MISPKAIGITRLFGLVTLAAFLLLSVFGLATQSEGIMSWLSNVLGKRDRDSTGAAQENRPVSYYSAKQAFARLSTHLRERSSPSPKLLWQVIPELSVFYREQFHGMVGGWVFFYEDEQGGKHEARANCWGELVVQPATTDLARGLVAPVKPSDWILDNTDAHVLVLEQGGEGNGDNIGGWLMAARVEGVGIRPVWAGHSWRLRAQGGEVSVDAYTGELYPRSGRTEKESAIVEWNGDFDPGSSGAQMSQSSYRYWWPRAYATTPLPRPAGVFGRLVYDRALLRRQLAAESAKTSRTASSWKTSGVLRAVLGDWLGAVDDLAQALTLAPDDDEIKYYRGLMLLVIRDFQSAVSHFKGLSSKFKQQSDDGLKNVAILKGQQKRELGAIILSMNTDVGSVPIEVWIGAAPLRASR